VTGLANGRGGGFRPGFVRPRADPISKRISDELAPLIEAEVAETVADAALSRDQKILRLSALKAMSGQRVSGFLKGMELYARSKGSLPDKGAARAALRKQTLDELNADLP
jgi:hypothetical protein